MKKAKEYEHLCEGDEFDYMISLGRKVKPNKRKKKNKKETRNFPPLNHY